MGLFDLFKTEEKQEAQKLEGIPCPEGFKRGRVYHHNKLRQLAEQIEGQQGARPDLDARLTTEKGIETITVAARKPNPDSKRGEQNEYIFESIFDERNKSPYQRAYLNSLNSDGENIGMFESEPLDIRGALRMVFEIAGSE